MGKREKRESRGGSEEWGWDKEERKEKKKRKRKNREIKNSKTKKLKTSRTCDIKVPQGTRQSRSIEEWWRDLMHQTASAPDTVKANEAMDGRRNEYWLIQENQDVFNFAPKVEECVRVCVPFITGTNDPLANRNDAGRLSSLCGYFFAKKEQFWSSKINKNAAYQAKKQLKSKVQDAYVNIDAMRDKRKVKSHVSAWSVPFLAFEMLSSVRISDLDKIWHVDWPELKLTCKRDKIGDIRRHVLVSMVHMSFCAEVCQQQFLLQTKHPSRLFLDCTCGRNDRISPTLAYW